MRNETGAKLGIAMSAAGVSIGSWSAMSGAISGLQSGANTAAEAGVFVGLVSCVFGLSMAFLATWYRRLAKVSERP